MIGRLFGVMLWVFTLLQPQITPLVIVIWAVAFALMAYGWTLIFPALTFAASIAMRIAEFESIEYFVALFLVVMSLMITVFTIPYGSVHLGGGGDGGYAGVDGGFDGGGDGGGAEGGC